MKSPGRHSVPTKFLESRELLLNLASSGAPISIIAAKAKIDRGTLNDWLRESDEWPEVAEFKLEFEARRATKLADSHDKVVSSEDTVDHRWLLERLAPEDYAAKHDGFGARPGDMAKPLTEAQEDHRMIQMLAHPTKRMRRCLAEALRRGNAAVHQIVDEWLRTRPMLTEGVTVEDAPQLGGTSLDIEERKLAFAALLEAHPRVAIGGGPKSGKTTFAALCHDRPTVHTDDYIQESKGTVAERAAAWKAAAELAVVECSKHAAFLVEGVRVTRVLKLGVEVDVLVWLETPLMPLTKGQETMRKGCETKLEALMAEMPQLKVVRI
jgi:hypothetical protein